MENGRDKKWSGGIEGAFEIFLLLARLPLG
jgi:hypothetical protein